jgi:hypothetical protein
VAFFLERREGIVIRTTVVPQEQLRLGIPCEYLNDYISLIKEYVPLVPAELIFDLNETGLSDWAMLTFDPWSDGLKESGKYSNPPHTRVTNSP